MDFNAYTHSIFNIQSSQQFNEISLGLFHYQYANNPVYKLFTDHLGINPEKVAQLVDIPFLPVSFFKTQKVVSGNFPFQCTFESSATTGMSTSKHHLADVSLYEKSFLKGFSQFYGDLSDYAVFALLPSYLERSNSSLVYMVERMLLRSRKGIGGFYLHEYQELRRQLIEANHRGLKILLIGVTYALLEMAENYPLDLHNAIIVETGGMKGRRQELTRAELHKRLCKGFETSSIHSEYGMTELLSQAWSKGEGVYNTPPWMKIFISDPNDPLSYMAENRTGGINVIDLCNIHSCSFIATQDLGRTLPDGSFEVLGRFDHSDTRGCSLMVS
jgi:hypothetical protein